MIPARVREGVNWLDVTILNVSRHGMMVRVRQALRRGSYVEVRRASIVIVGRVVWSCNDRCGIRAQDRIDLGDLLKPGSTPENWSTGDRDRRVVDRDRGFAQQRHALTARKLQFFATMTIVGISCYFIFSTVTSILGAATDKIKIAL